MFCNIQLHDRRCLFACLTALLDTKDKPYLCHCGAAFARRDLLTRHERLSHGHNGSYPKIQASTDHQALTDDTVAQPLVETRGAVGVSASDWAAPNSDKSIGRQWPQQDQSSETVHQNWSDDALGTLSRTTRPVQSVRDVAITEEQYGQPMPQNGGDASLSPGTRRFATKWS